MTDLDFDELDRAVNSLIGDTDRSVVEKPTPEADTQAAPAPVNVETKTEDQPETQSTEQNVSEVAPVVAPIQDETPSVVDPQLVQPQPLAARRSSGRFMDVVHPSSDMRTMNKVAARPVATPTLSTPGELPVLSEDVSGQSLVTPEKTETIVSDSSEGQESAVVSPFLPDAKVEKRPLGAFADNEKPSPALNDLMQKELDSSELPEASVKLVEDDKEPSQGIETIQQPKTEDADEMPEELQGDILSIETKESDAEVAPDVLETQPAPTINAPVAITQQYVEKAQTPEVESGAIFDTDAYQQPATTGKAHHSGWMTVLWIFLLIILGAGAGVAIYTYVLPLL